MLLVVSPWRDLYDEQKVRLLMFDNPPPSTPRAHAAVQDNATTGTLVNDVKQTSTVFAAKSASRETCAALGGARATSGSNDFDPGKVLHARNMSRPTRWAIVS